MDMDMHHGQGHAPWTRTCTVDKDMHRGQGHAPWTWTCTMDMDIEMDIHHGCQNADKKFSLASLVFISLQHLVRHWHSGIVVSPVTLITDYSVSAQLCCLMRYRCGLIY
jgi:hypothetical protein